MNELHAVEAVGDGGIVERAVVGRTARLHRQNGADDVLVDVGKGDDQSLGMAGGDAAVRAGLLAVPRDRVSVGLPLGVYFR